MTSTPFKCYNPARGPCRVCAKDGGLPCARCRVDYYCSKEHQTQDWPRHKAACGALEVCTDRRVGRHVVATKDIPVGARLMCEEPLVLLPRSHAVCVGCYRSDPRQRCGHCGFLVCGPDCSDAEAHQPECRAFQRAGFKLTEDVRRRMALPRHPGDPANEALDTALVALRVALAFESQPKLLELQHDFQKLTPEIDSPPWSGIGMSVEMSRARNRWRHAAAWLRGEAQGEAQGEAGAGLSWLPEETLVRAAGARAINAVGAMIENASALFAGPSLLEHSCAPNVVPAVDGKSCVLVAARNVRRGEHLSISYRPVFMDDTAARRHLLRRHGFCCRCVRCSDITDGGLYLGSVACPVCAQGAALGLAVVDMDVSHVVRCSRCGAELPPLTFDAPPLVGHSIPQRRELMALTDNPAARPRDLEQFVERNLWPRGVLHPTHALILCAKKTVIERFGDTPQQDAVLERWVGYCRDLLEAHEKFNPIVSPFTFMIRMTLMKVLQRRLDMVKGKKGLMQQLTNDINKVAAQLLTEQTVLHQGNQDFKCLDWWGRR